MTGETILRRGLQVCYRARVEMASCASHIRVFPGQLKNKFGVSEIVSEPVHTIVARQTIRPEGQEVCLGEANVHLTVATIAGGRSEGHHILAMTIGTGKRFTRGRELVSV